MTVTDNTAHRGAGLRAQDSSALDLQGSTVSANTASQDGASLSTWVGERLSGG